MANDNVKLPVKIYLQVRDGVLSEVGQFDIEVFHTRALTEDEKIHPDAKLDHTVRLLDLAAVLREGADSLVEEYERRVDERDGLRGA